MYYQDLKMLSRPPMSEIHQEFHDLVRQFDLEDWRTIRNENYWWKDTSFGTKRPTSIYEKLEFIRYYVAKGVPKPHSDDEI